MSEKKKGETIHLKASSNPGSQWGDISHPETAEYLAKNVLAVAEALARKHYPQHACTTEVTEDYTETALYGTPPEIVADLGVLLYEHGMDQEVLGDPDFNLQAYLDDHPLP